MADKKEKHLLLVEDDESLGYLLSEYLKIKNFQVVWTKTGKEAIKAIETEKLDLAILDIMLPDLDGFTLAGHIKQQHPELPFLFLSARSLKIDVLKGFALGAVDYLKKPIDEEELVARINNLLDRLIIPEARTSKEPIHRIGDYNFNSSSQELRHKEESIALTARESELLLFLSENRNQLCSHKDILNLLWGKNDYFNRKSLNVFIFHLRKYLSHDPRIRIDNVHKKGFILKIESA